jgi:HD-GYP domain-containing protein (c-di-GMP phosphodiesterase class II)
MSLPVAHATRVGEGALAPTPFGDLMARLRCDGRLAGRRITQPHPLVVSVRDDTGNVVLIAPSRAWENGREVFAPFADAFGAARGALIFVGAPSLRGIDEALHRGLSATVPAGAGDDEVYIAIHNAFELLSARQRSERRGEWVNRYRTEIGEFVEIARAITTEREIDKLLALILEKARFITSADAGSVYVVEGEDPDIARRTLRFKLSQNDSVSFDSSEFSVPVSARSVSGHVALHRTTLNIADVYDLPPGTPYGVDRSFDETIGYRTKSMLCTPLLSRMGDVIGVLQLINRKRDPAAKLIDFKGDLDQVIPFDSRSEGLLTTLASLAGVALENAFLAADNERMLEGFVRASVEAIEQRDPTTSGHSIRVAGMTLGLADAVQRLETGPYKDVNWSPDDLRELEYASLLHDFGKIGVREQVLVKAKKLYPQELEIVRSRFALAARSMEVEILSRKLEAQRRGASPQELDQLDEELERRRSALVKAFEVIRDANEPKVLSGGDYAVLESIARQTYCDHHGELKPLLLPEEVHCLSVPRGSLTPSEFDEIRSHVVHTFEFLSTIPWGRKFRRVAQIAVAHHERLDGTGYPHRLRGSEIPLQSKIMTVSDIFDALTAADRPYKKAVPLERALDILHMEVQQGHIDGELVRVFTEAQVWTRLDNFNAP